MNVYIPIFNNLINQINLPFIYIFGIFGIFIPVVFVVYAIVFKVKNVELNNRFGYRTPLALSSKEKWEWCNNMWNKLILILEPIFLVLHIIIFILSIINGWIFVYTLLTMIIPIVCMVLAIIFIEIAGRHKFKE